MNSIGGNNPSGGKTWTNHRIEWLRALWTAGHTAAQIAAIMGNGISRNSVIGAARRAGCEPRQSPIARLTDEQRAARKQPISRPHIVINVTRDGLKKSMSARIANSQTCARKRAERETEQRREMVGRPPQQPTALQPVLAQSRPPLLPPEPKNIAPIVPWDGKPVRFNQLQPGQCKWISGTTVRHHADEAMACTAPIVSGMPYCQHHCERAAGKVAQDLDGLKAAE